MTKWQVDGMIKVEGYIVVDKVVEAEDSLGAMKHLSVDEIDKDDDLEFHPERIVDWKYFKVEEKE